MLISTLDVLSGVSVGCTSTPGIHPPLHTTYASVKGDQTIINTTNVRRRTVVFG